MYQQYSIRRNKIRRQVIREHLDAFLISNPINVRYLTGFTGNDSYLLIKRSGDQILSDTRFTIQIEEECPGLEVYFRASGETMPLAIARLFGKTTSGKLGLEADSLTITGLERISQAIPSWQMVPKRNFVEELRQIKDRYEIQLIRKAIDIAYQSFLDLRTFLSSERSEIEIRNELEYRMRCHGAEEKSFPSIIGVGSRAALPHGCPGLSKIAGHSHLLIDWGTIYKGYMSDLTRVLIFSAKDKKFRTVYETVLNAQAAAIKAIKPGKTCSEIDEVARSVIRDAGFGNYFAHGLGHSFGLEIHESPRFVSGCDTVLKSGMVMTVEPGIYLKNWGGVRIEDDVLITKNGCEVLSQHVPKSFDEMYHFLQ